MHAAAGCIGHAVWQGLRIMAPPSHPTRMTALHGAAAAEPVAAGALVAGAAVAAGLMGFAGGGVAAGDGRAAGGAVAPVPVHLHVARMCCIGAKRGHAELGTTNN